jgi:ferredoxin
MIPTSCRSDFAGGAKLRNVRHLSANAMPNRDRSQDVGFSLCPILCPLSVILVDAELYSMSCTTFKFPLRHIHGLTPNTIANHRAKMPPQAWGACGRRFKSGHPDHRTASLTTRGIAVAGPDCARTCTSSCDRRIDMNVWGFGPLQLD